MYVKCRTNFSVFSSLPEHRIPRLLRDDNKCNSSLFLQLFPLLSSSVESLAIKSNLLQGTAVQNRIRSLRKAEEKDPVGLRQPRSYDLRAINASKVRVPRSKTG